MGLGMPEVVLILVIALIVFGPRKLPELGKSLGQAMNQFRRASDDFKRTWEQEVELDKVRKGEGSSSSSSDYSSSDSYNDPYNPYGSDSESHQPAALASENQDGSSPVASAAVGSATEQEKAEAATVGVGNGSSAATEPKKQHWI